MPRWLFRALNRIRKLAERDAVRFTLKAEQELAELDVTFEPGDARDVLAGLFAEDFVVRLRSETTGEWMYVFKPYIGEVQVYLKLIVRNDVHIVSFHDDEDDRHETEV